MKPKIIAAIFLLVLLAAVSAGVAEDTSPPSVSLGSPSDNTNYYLSEGNFTYSVSDSAEVLWCRLHLNETVYQIDNNVSSNRFYNVSLLNGTFEWHVECMDNSSNVGSSGNNTLHISIEGRAPVVNVYPLNSSSNGTGFSVFKYKPHDLKTEIKSCELILDGEPNKTRTTISNNTHYSFSGTLTPGTHSWKVNCTDQEGNEGESPSLDMSVEYSPYMRNLTPVEGETIYGKSVNFTYVPASSAKLVSCFLMLNKTPDPSEESKSRKKANYTVNETTTDVENNSVNNFYVELSNGTWFWKVNCTDEEGVSGVSNINKLFLFEAPETNPVNVSLSSPKTGVLIKDGRVSFSYKPVSSTDLSSCELLLNNSVVESKQDPGRGGTHTFKNVELSNGPWTWKVTCSDKFGYSYSTSPRTLRVSREINKSTATTETMPEEEELEQEGLPPVQKETKRVLILTVVMSIVLLFAVMLIHEDTRYQIFGKFLSKEEEKKIEELEEYIESHLNKGHAEEEIRRQLEKFNWAPDHVRLAMSRVKKRRKNK